MKPAPTATLSPWWATGSGLEACSPREYRWWDRRSQSVKGSPCHSSCALCLVPAATRPSLPLEAGMPTWTGGPDGDSVLDWNDPDGWDTKAVPVDGDSVVITSDLTMSLPGSAGRYR